MAEIYKVIGDTIKELRGQTSQDALATELGIKSNKLSRWETGTYKPTAADLDKLARYFNVPITIFFPGQISESERISALASATGGLDDEDFNEVVRYAQFRKAQIALQKAKKSKRK